MSLNSATEQNYSAADALRALRESKLDGQPLPLVASMASSDLANTLQRTAALCWALDCWVATFVKDPDYAPPLLAILSVIGDENAKAARQAAHLRAAATLGMASQEGVSA